MLSARGALRRCPQRVVCVSRRHLNSSRKRTASDGRPGPRPTLGPLPAFPGELHLAPPTAHRRLLCTATPDTHTLSSRVKHRQALPATPCVLVLFILPRRPLLHPDGMPARRSPGLQLGPDHAQEHHQLTSHSIRAGPASSTRPLALVGPRPSTALPRRNFDSRTPPAPARAPAHSHARSSLRQPEPTSHPAPFGRRRPRGGAPRPLADD